MSRQVSTLSDMPDLFDGMSRQVSANALVQVPLYPELVSNRVKTAGRTPKSCPMQQYPELMSMAMVRQVGLQKGNVNARQVVAIQMPVLIEVPYVQMPMPMMASIANMTPQAMSETKVQIEKALLAAMPASYED
jgi:hypothetical protein